MKESDKDFCGLREQLAQLLEGAPAEEFKKNSRAAAAAILARLNVVGREEFDAHCEMLARAVVRLRELEKQIAQLEKNAAPSPSKPRTARKKVRGESEAES